MGDVWIADTGNNRIISFDPSVLDGYNLDSINVVPVRFDNQAGNMSQPIALDINQETGDVWVADTGNDRVFRIKVDLTSFIIEGFQNPRGLAVNKSDGSCWISNTIDNEVIKISDDIFDLPNNFPLASYNIDIDAGFHLTVTGFTQPIAIDVNVNENIVWFAEEFRIIKLLDNEQTFSKITKFTNFNAPHALIVNPGTDF